MSDSSHSHADDSNPIAAMVGKIFYIFVPAALIVMMGVVGAAFMGGGGYRPEPPAPVSAEASTVAAVTKQPPAEAPAGTADSSAEAPAAGKADAAPAGTVAASGSAAPSPEQMALGQTTYMMCAACHGPDGQGIQAGPQKMAPSFVDSQLLLGKPEASLAAVLKGIEKKPDSPYLGQMAALGAGLDDEKLAAVLTYVRNSFGNQASAVTVEDAAAARAKYASVTAPMGLPREDLEKVAADE